jgi:HSP20 family protein
MVQLRRYDPLRELQALRDRVDRILQDPGQAPVRRGEEDLPPVAWTPAVDIHETGDAIVVRAELPGVPKDGVRVEVREGILTFRGERKEKREVREENYHRMECSYGTFFRSFSLPPTADPGKVEAALKDGVLEIRVGKKETAMPKRISVKVD